MFTTPVFQRRAIAAACTLLIAGLASAQSADSGADAPIESVTVTGNWLGSGQQSVKTFAGARTVVKREDIQQSGADSVSDVLRAVPGLQITDLSLIHI